MSLRIDVLHALSDNFIYALSDERGHCAIIDPGESKPVLEFLQRRNLRLTHVLCTHHHHDHIDGLPELREKFSPEVWTSKWDQTRIPGSTRGLSEGESLNLFGQELKILEVKGHTLGQICFWFPQLQAVFVGDTLFSCGCGRLFEGTYEQLWESLAKLKKLPPETAIYFGHEYTLRNLQFVMERQGTTPELQAYREECEKKIGRGQDTTPTILARELALNPFLKAKSLSELREWREARNDWRPQA